MNDRDSLFELFEIVSEGITEKKLPLSAQALTYIGEHLNSSFEVYFRRRLSVCRMLMDIHLPLSLDQLDTVVAVAISHYLPVDIIPHSHDKILSDIFSKNPNVAEILSILKHKDYNDKSYYSRLIKNPYALIIRLCERGVLVETLYEWSNQDARRFIRETREHFFPMCIYAKEHYPEFLGPVSILMEKTRNLIMANEVMLNRFEDSENSMNMEILTLQEENADLKAMISEISQLRQE